jgi:hypothetical protein
VLENGERRHGVEALPRCVLSERDAVASNPDGSAHQTTRVEQKRAATLGRLWTAS